MSNRPARHTTRLYDSEYDFDDLDFDGYPLLEACKERLVKVANDYYGPFEIVGITEYDFLVYLQSEFNLGAGTLEKYLTVYEDIVPDYEYNEVTTYQNDTTSNSSTLDDEIPLDADDGSPTRSGNASSVANQSGSTSRSGRFGAGLENTSERLDKFLKLNKTIEQLFVDMFRKCFVYSMAIT